MNPRIILLIIITFFTYESYYAQNIWTLQQCIDTALKNNLSLMQSVNTLNITRYQHKQNRYNAYPNIEATANESFNQKIYNQNSDNSNWTTSVGLNANFTLFNGLNNYYAIKQSAIRCKASEYELIDYKDKLTINVLNFYLDVLYAIDAIKIAQNQVEVSQNDVKLTEAFIASGKQTEYNLLLVKSQLSTDKLTLTISLNQYKTAMLNLRQLLDIQTDIEFKPAYSDTFQVPLLASETSVDIYNQSLMLMPSIQIFHQNTEIEKLKLKQYSNFWMPQLNLRSGISTNYSNSSGELLTNYSSNSTLGSQFKNNLDASFSLVLSIPIFSKFQNRTNIKIQKIAIENSILEQKLANNSLRKEIEQAFNDLLNTIMRYNALKEQYDAIKNAYENSIIKYENGLLPTNDLIVEKNKLIKSESDLLFSKYEIIFKSKILDYYKGIKISL